jgi:predicted phosphodiesterase
MAAMTWLHLSDWHHGNKGTQDRALVRDALIDDIENRTAGCDPRLEKLDFVFFTGDLANRGARDEYDAAGTEFLDRIVAAANITPDRLLLVPGNHDVDRSRLTFLPDLLKRFSKREEVAEALSDANIRSQVLFPMKTFSHFVKEYLGSAAPAEPDFAFTKLIDGIAGKKIGLIGMNSAWMCGQFHDPYANNEVNDYGRLILSETQLRENLPALLKSKPDVVIALMHHPFHWLSETESRADIEDELIRKCHFILRGHEHRANVTVPIGTAGNCAVISAGAAYDRRDWPNGYNYVLLDFDLGQGTAFLRYYDDRAQRFLGDAAITPGTAGFVSFTLPKQLGQATRVRGTGGQAAAVPASTKPVVAGNPWSVQSPAAMAAIGEVYRAQHEASKFEYVSMRLFVQANSLLPEPGPDLVLVTTRFKPAGEPIYCQKISLMWSEGSEYVATFGWSVRNFGGPSPRVIDIPTIDQRYPNSKQLLLFFDPILQPGDKHEYEVELLEYVKDSMRPLRDDGKDDLFVIPTRAKGKVGQIEIILLVPRRFGKVELRPGTRENSSGEGGPMSDQQLQAALSEIEMQLAETKQLGQTDWKRPTNFDAYGWTGRDLRPDRVFAADVLKRS